MKSDNVYMNEDRKIRLGAQLLIALLVVAAGSKSILYDTLDPDAFWHLRVADQLQREGIRPIVDQLSFMSVKEPWTPYSWLAELGMKAIWDQGGFRLAILVQACLIAGMYALIAAACWRRTQSRLGVTLVLLISIWMSLPYLSFRPATAALAMLAGMVWLLMVDREQPTKWVWMLVPGTVLMVNVHLFAVVVPILVGAMWASDLIERRARLSEHAASRYGALFLLTSLACLCTPMLGGLVRTMWHYQSADPMVAATEIAELRPFYAGPTGFVGVLVLAACFALAFWRRKTMPVWEWLWLIGATALLCRMGRFAPLFGIIAAPVVAGLMPRMRGAVLGKPLIRLTLASLLCIGVARIVMGFPMKMPLDAFLNRNGPETPGYPCEAAAYIESNVPRVSGHVLNDFSWGGYLAWRLGPEYQTFMDGRTQLYSNAFWKNTCLATQEAYADFLRTVPADAAIVPKDRGTLRASVIELGWKRVYGDERAEVWVPVNSVAHTD